MFVVALTIGLIAGVVIPSALVKWVAWRVSWAGLATCGVAIVVMALPASTSSRVAFDVALFMAYLVSLSVPQRLTPFDVSGPAEDE